MARLRWRAFAVVGLGALCLVGTETSAPSLRPGDWHSTAVIHAEACAAFRGGIAAHSAEEFVLSEIVPPGARPLHARIEDELAAARFVAESCTRLGISPSIRYEGRFASSTLVLVDIDVRCDPYVAMRFEVPMWDGVPGPLDPRWRDWCAAPRRR